jgi:hypothetical protein
MFFTSANQKSKNQSEEAFQSSFQVSSTTGMNESSESNNYQHKFESNHSSLISVTCFSLLLIKRAKTKVKKHFNPHFKQLLLA